MRVHFACENSEVSFFCLLKLLSLNSVLWFCNDFSYELYDDICSVCRWCDARILNPISKFYQTKRLEHIYTKEFFFSFLIGFKKSYPTIAYFHFHWQIFKFYFNICVAIVIWAVLSMCVLCMRVYLWSRLFSSMLIKFKSLILLGNCFAFVGIDRSSMLRIHVFFIRI